MFARLVWKEIHHYLLDYRFISVFAVCVLVTALSVHMGILNYDRQLQDHSSSSQADRKGLDQVLASGSLMQFAGVGYFWSRPPEVLSPIVFGLSAKLGREARIHYQLLPEFDCHAIT